ncbi:hypothetical protein [Bathymodiolus thermophilus thioautotrophic gill symbiont]|uniref:2TM domain-containing protein n=1 Tax=Bathymodiolus thermophilus thioautotrophic gill symbiont TaxID=2360 RepID=A0A1J5UG39_9GAMM|nr:hypothetical protein [Bathymodiolus thermophilus thioautotrophic gill symbiont]OIR24893.1 hypothetical protein BGC33_04850 [Bathymodiolus thermophilus thioautotrophic gill symbiont]
MLDNQPNNNAIFEILNDAENSADIPSVEARKQEIHNEELKRTKQNTEQQKELAGKIFWLLIIQVVFLMLMIIFQAFGFFGFKLNNWVFGFFINGSLIHTYLLMKQIVTGVYFNEKI